MRCHLIVLFVAVFAGIPLFAQSQAPAKADQAAIVAFEQKAAVQALNFQQGDVASLTHARADFTPEGWRDFMKHMEGFLDQKGAPTFSSSFVPSRNAVIVGEENGMVHLRIPGTLKQTQNQSSTTYRAAIDVRAGGKPIKIQHLEQMTLCWRVNRLPVSVRYDPLFRRLGGWPSPSQSYYPQGCPALVFPALEDKVGMFTRRVSPPRFLVSAGDQANPARTIPPEATIAK